MRQYTFQDASGEATDSTVDNGSTSTEHKKEKQGAPTLSF